MRSGSGSRQSTTAVPLTADADAVALGQDLDVVPVVLLADLLGRAAVHRQAVAAEQVVHAPAGGEHHEVALVGVLGAVLLRVVTLPSAFGYTSPQNATPECISDSDQLAGEREAEVGELLLRQQVGAVLQRLGVLADDHAVLDRPEIGVAFPAVERLAVEELDRLGLALARA